MITDPSEIVCDVNAELTLLLKSKMTPVVELPEKPENVAPLPIVIVDPKKKMPAELAPVPVF
ncbi:MAG: hypothetical protein ACFUZC_10400 [Chthoniobacteraceae bacterium]